MVKWGCRELADPKMAEWHLIELAGASGAGAVWALIRSIVIRAGVTR